MGRSTLIVALSVLASALPLAVSAQEAKPTAPACLPAVTLDQLPKALDEAGLLALVAEAVAEVAAASSQKPTPKEIGTVIKAVQAKLQAKSLRAEGRVISEMVKKVL